MEERQSYKPFRDWELKTSDLTTQQRREARAFLFGSFRQIKDHFTGRPIVPQLLHEAYDIHHLVERGAPGCNLLINLRLAVHSANANAGKPKRRPGIRTHNNNKESVPVDETTLLRTRVDYSEGSKQMQVNGEAEPRWRALTWELLEYGGTTMTKERAIYGLAERIGVSPQATRDYYNKAKSDDGPFEEYREDGQKRIRVKRDWFK